VLLVDRGPVQQREQAEALPLRQRRLANITTSVDTQANRICGQASSLSPFAIFESAFTFSGFLAPVDNPPVRNVVKSGSAVPVKFSLGGDFGLSIFASAPGSQVTTCATNAPVDEILETVSAGASQLTYDAASSRYQYVWKTEKSWANSCRRLILKFNDGPQQVADFQFK
jgi:hypothetical protein